MAESTSIEWQEYRGIHECFWVSAAQLGGQWIFQDKSEEDLRWYDVQASPELIATAEALAGHTL
jgi:hypothetical protein